MARKPTPITVESLREQLTARLEELRPAHAEFEEVSRALAALDGAVEPEAKPKRHGKHPGRNHGEPAVAKSAKPRAKRGENVAKVLAAVEERPGVTATTLAEVTGIDRPVVYGVLRKLVGDGKLVQEDLGGGVKGHKLASQEA